MTSRFNNKMAFGAVALFVSALALQAEDTRSWETGKVLDSSTARSLVQTGATTVGSATTSVNGSADDTGYGTTYSGTATSVGSSHTSLEYMNIKDSQLLIVGKEYAYVVHDEIRHPESFRLKPLITSAITNRKHGCRVIVNDNVQYSQERGKLYLVDADGKTCKLDIDKQVHLTN